MSQPTTFVGLDVHRSSIQISVLLPGGDGRLEWQSPNTPQAVRKMARLLREKAPGELLCCYEAGPCGYTLQRQLAARGIPCQVIAPSLIPVKPGERIKTDHRDARKLAEMLRAGLLTEVQPPTEEDEALRDLCRCRDTVRQDITRARHRLGKFLLRRGCTYTHGKRAWGSRHRLWLRSLRFDRAADQATFDSYLLALEQLEERLLALDDRLAELGNQPPYREPVAWLRCFRGIDTVTAVSLVAELHDFRRFRSPRALMAYLGLVPTEHSSGDGRRRGSITRAGNNHVRRLLVEVAWHYRHRPAIGLHLRQRRQGQPARVVAQARELVGYLWAALHPDLHTSAN